jgi:hypothetical protein
MAQLTVDGLLGREVVIDACRSCRAFWFDPHEDLQLTPASTIQLFKMMAEGASSAAPFPTISRCPVCETRLLLTHDRQRNTPFVYWRCDQEHGRFTPFVEFLKQKDFVRAPTPQQLAELRRTIRVIRCGGCGAPIDLLHAVVCGHCGAAVSILDVKQLGELAPNKIPPPHQLTPPRLGPALNDKPPTLIDLGLEVILGWLGEII